MSSDGRAPDNLGSELENRLAAGSTGRNVGPEEPEYDDEDDRMGRPKSSNGAESEVQQKKPRLQWDEDNLLSNALEKERNAYPKIDEPKTPYHALSGSEGGSSSGSAPQSPGSPAFISRDQLVGFTDLERSASRTSSDGHARSVQIAEDAGASSGGDSSPRSREEFEAKRKQHYRDEFPKFLEVDVEDEGDLDDEETPDVVAAREVSGATSGISPDDANRAEADGVDAGEGETGRDTAPASGGPASARDAAAFSAQRVANGLENPHHGTE
jgi:Protein phosphatase inhibitor 2 (IPP-2)